MASNPELLAAYGALEHNPFWIEYRKRLAALRDASVVTVSTYVVEDQAGIWNIARAQGSIGAFRAALSLPETMVGPRVAESKLK